MNLTGKVSILCLALCAFFACGEDEESLLTKRTAIETYLSGNAYLKDFEYDVVSEVYRVVENGSRDGYAGQPVAATGDVVEFRYQGYIFSSNMDLSPDTLNPTYLFATNDAATLARVTDQAWMKTLPAWNPEHWSAEPVEAKLGSTALVKGLQLGIMGARQQDSLLLFFAYDLGYGDKEFPSVEEYSTLVFRVIIDKVN